MKYWSVLFQICHPDDGKGAGEKRGQRRPSEQSLRLFYSLCQKILGLKKLEGEIIIACVGFTLNLHKKF